MPVGDCGQHRVPRAQRMCVGGSSQATDKKSADGWRCHVTEPSLGWGLRPAPGCTGPQHHLKAGPARVEGALRAHVVCQSARPSSVMQLQTGKGAKLQGGQQPDIRIQHRRQESTASPQVALPSCQHMPRKTGGATPLLRGGGGRQCDARRHVLRVVYCADPERVRRAALEPVERRRVQRRCSAAACERQLRCATDLGF